MRRSARFRAIELRLGDGLSVVTADEVDVICIAGMGPVLMASILRDGLDLFRDQAVRLVLNPLGGCAAPRAFLVENGFQMVADAEVLERGRSYRVLVADRDR